MALFGCAPSGSHGGGSAAATTATSRPASTATPAATTSSTTATTPAPRSTPTAPTPAPVATSTLNKPVLVVCGLQQEEQIAQGPNVVICLSASDTTLLRQRLSALNPGDYKAVVSFGVSGGLLPGFKCGDLMIARQVLAASGTGGPWTCDVNVNTQIVTKLAAAGMNVPLGIFVGEDTLVVNSAQAKAALRAATGADSVDMESHIAAEFAAKANVPFTAIRSPSDDDTESLPPAALVPLHQDGSTDYVAVTLSIVQNPWQIPALFQLYQDTDAAMSALKKARAVVDLGGL